MRSNWGEGSENLRNELKKITTPEERCARVTPRHVLKGSALRKLEPALGCVVAALKTRGNPTGVTLLQMGPSPFTRR